MGPTVTTLASARPRIGRLLTSPVFTLLRKPSSRSWAESTTPTSPTFRCRKSSVVPPDGESWGTPGPCLPPEEGPQYTRVQTEGRLKPLELLGPRGHTKGLGDRRVSRRVVDLGGEPEGPSTRRLRSRD